MTKLRVFLLITYVAMIFFVSSRPYLQPPGPQFVAKDKIAHFLEYAGLGGFLVAGIGWTLRRSRPAPVFLFLFAVGVSVGALDEMLQSYIPGRATDPVDWLADAVGVAIGVSVALALTRRKRARSAA